MLTAKPTTVAPEVGFSFGCINCERMTMILVSAFTVAGDRAVHHLRTHPISRMAAADVARQNADV